MSKHESTALYPLARAAEVLAFYESPGAPEFPGAQPTIRINAEDFASLLADVRSSLATHAQLVEALSVFVDFPADTFDGEHDAPFTMTVRLRDLRNARAALAAVKGDA